MLTPSEIKEVLKFLWAPLLITSSFGMLLALFYSLLPSPDTRENREIEQLNVLKLILITVMAIAFKICLG